MPSILNRALMVGLLRKYVFRGWLSVTVDISELKKPPYSRVTIELYRKGPYDIRLLFRGPDEFIWREAHFPDDLGIWKEEQALRKAIQLHNTLTGTRSIYLEKRLMSLRLLHQAENLLRHEKGFICH